MLRKQHQVIVAGLETGYGVLIDLVGTTAMLASDLDVNMLEANQQERNNAVGHFGHQGSVTTNKRITASFGIEFAPATGATTPPQWGKLLQACGMARTIGADYVMYTPVGAQFSSIGMIYRIANVQQHLRGARGKWVLNLDAGSVPMLKFDFESLYTAPTTEVTTLSGVDVSAFNTPIAVSEVATSVRLFGVAVAFSETTEEQSIEITGRKGSVSLSFRTSDVELVTAIQDADLSKEGHFEATHGIEVGKRLTIDVPNVQVRSAKVSWDNDIASIDLVADIRPLAANTDLSIKQY